MVQALWRFNVALCEIFPSFLAAMGLTKVWSTMQPFLFLLVILNILNYFPVWLLFMAAATAVFYLLLFKRMARNNPDPHFF